MHTIRYSKFLQAYCRVLLVLLLKLLRRGVSHLQEIDRLLVFGGGVRRADPKAVPAGLRRDKLERAGLAVGSGTNELGHLLVRRVVQVEFDLGGRRPVRCVVEKIRANLVACVSEMRPTFTKSALSAGLISRSGAPANSCVTEN